MGKLNLTKDFKIDTLPRAGESIVGGKYLLDLLAGGAPNIPTRGIAGLGETTQSILQALPSRYDNYQQNIALSEQNIQDTIEGKYDVRKSPLYQEQKATAQDLKTASSTITRQESQKKGILKSSASQAAEAENVREIDQVLLDQLGLMFEQKRVSQGRAAEDIQQFEANKIAVQAGIIDIAEAETRQKQAISDATYNAILTQTMMPFNELLKIASGMQAHDPGVIRTGGGKKDWLVDVEVIAKMYASLYGGGVDTSGSDQYGAGSQNNTIQRYEGGR